jgi:predicted RNA polymerase sigma factor
VSISPALKRCGSKRLVRAKEKIRQAGISFLVREGSELPARLDAVLETVYAVYGSTSDRLEDKLAEEAIFLAKLVVDLVPDQPEAFGLLALLLYIEGRRSARRTEGGEYVPLEEQDRELWDWGMI